MDRLERKSPALYTYPMGSKEFYLQLRTSRLNAKVAGPAREWQQKHSKMLGSAARGPEKRMAGVSTFQLGLLVLSLCEMAGNANRSSRVVTTVPLIFSSTWSLLVDLQGLLDHPDAFGSKTAKGLTVYDAFRQTIREH